MAAGGHVALGGLGGLDIDDGVEEEGFAVLAAEVLEAMRVSIGLVNGLCCGSRQCLPG